MLIWKSWGLVSILHSKRRIFHPRGPNVKKLKNPAVIDSLTTHPIPSRRNTAQKNASRKHRVGKLIIISGRNAGKEYQCYSQSTFIGRNRENHVTIVDTAASRRHARIERRNGDFILEDLNSTNGTLVNQKAIGREILHHGDKIQIGETVLQFLVKERT
ncbi:MAG: FHA domain-containing protein [Proteobacteria bacterium]|nr:FHA domain-containing protein [Pseudomonadota bacterium]